jgi:hypothetical protein
MTHRSDKIYSIRYFSKDFYSAGGISFICFPRTVPLITLFGPLAYEFPSLRSFYKLFLILHNVKILHLINNFVLL